MAVSQLYQQNLGLGLPLGVSQSWVFGDDMLLKQQQQQFQMFQNQWLQQKPPLLDQRSFLGSAQSLCFEKQRHEIDEFMALQNERLRLVLEKQRNHEMVVLMKEIESTAQILLAQKDQEIAAAAKRTVELESFLVKLEMENRTWQRVAHENEAMVVSLSNTLEQLSEQGCFSTSAEDADSCCGGDVNGVVCDRARQHQ